MEFICLSVTEDTSCVAGPNNRKEGTKINFSIRKYELQDKHDLLLESCIEIAIISSAQ